MDAERDISGLPKDFEEYRLVRPLGRGAMGEVYLAEDTLLERLVAVKFIAAPSPGAAARDRFYAEARAIARLSHPNVVAVHRVGEVRRRPFLVSEYVRGQSLAELDKPIGWQQAHAIGIGLARGLAAAHRRGVLHRDIKPANAMISEDGEVKLLDFGLAKLLPAPGEEGSPETARAEVTAAFSAAQDGGATASLDTRSRREGGAYDDTMPAEEPLRSCSVVGTPLYMAPEVWRGEPSTSRADVYALGVLLYELCVGRAPHQGVALAELLRVVQEVAPTPVAEAAPGVDPRLAAVIDRCLARDPARRFDDGDALREALEQLSAKVAMAAVPEGDPYRGLFAFEAEHRGLFFGRDAEVRAILDRLRAQPFVLVAGDSGAGKSSLCRAGVLPAVAHGALGAGAPSAIEIAIARLGRHPLAALAAALAPVMGSDERTVEERLREDPDAFGRALRRPQGGVLLFIDQLEELCTLADPTEAALVAGALTALVRWSGGVRLLATARGDFLGRLGALPGFGEEIPLALYLLRPLAPERLRDVIIGPAAANGFSFGSEEMIAALIEETALAEGGLALLSFTLAELWGARDEARRLIPASALDAIGGVNGALARHADGVLASLPPPQRAAARRLVVALIHPDGTRAQRTEDELLLAEQAFAKGDAAARTIAHAALDALVRGRLLVARRGEGEQSAYEIAHEALIRGWDTLRGWLSGDAERRAAQHRIERAAAEWERLGNAADALWSGRLLEEARGIEPEALGPREAAFLVASRRVARRQRLRRWAAVGSVPLLAGLAALVLRVKSARDMDRSIAVHVDGAQTALTEARTKDTEAERQRRSALDDFLRGDTAGGEVVWERALALSAHVDRAYARASQDLEIALQLDRGRSNVRALLCDALYERAALAERYRRFAQSDELIARLDACDDGQHRRRWEAPGHIAVTTSPPGAEVSLQRFEVADRHSPSNHGSAAGTGDNDEPKSAGGRRVLLAPRALGKTPLKELELAQGSFLLTITAGGRTSIRFPFVLERAELRRIDLALPPASAVPEGFVYVPPGRFFFGMPEEGQLRRMLNAQPQHAAETGAYLIARYEVTFAEWIAYLRALPPEERARRMPGAEAEGHGIATGTRGASLRLKELEGGTFELWLQPTTEEYRVREGELLRYPARTERAAQDWRRFPISAVSFDDAQAYAAWLDRTGRVPGARLCTELEWERAARGADDRLFPSGDRFDTSDANHNATYGLDPRSWGPDEVGAHPASESPLGAHDLAGNAWEWTISAEPKGGPVLRGGGWYHDALSMTSSNREQGEPTLRHVLIGIRLCATPRTHRD